MLIDPSNKKRCGTCGGPVGVPPYIISGDFSGTQFCSRKCVDVGFENLKKGAKRHKKDSHMEVPATDFGEAGVTRQLCDKCQQPVALAWRGRYGTYCSNKCLKEAETMTDATATPAAPAPAKSAIKVPAKKAAAKKTTKPAKAAKPAKEAPKAKAAPKAKGKVGDFAPGSKKADMLEMLKKGATVPQMSKKIGWQPQAIRAAMWAMGQKGIKIESEKKPGEDTVFSTK